MDSVRSLLPKVLRKRGLYDQAAASLVTFRAQEWLRREFPELGEKLEVTHLKDGTLTIACENGIAAQECRFQLGNLHSFLQQECPDAVISDIRVERMRRA